MKISLKSRNGFRFKTSETLHEFVIVQSIGFRVDPRMIPQEPVDLNMRRDVDDMKFLISPTDQEGRGLVKVAGVSRFLIGVSNVRDQPVSHKAEAIAQ